MPAPGPRVSLRAIARAVGFSLGTVSRALRDDPAIAIPTRERIKAVARELGYRPDAEMTRFLTAVRGTSPRHGRETIGLLWTDPPELHLHENPYNRRLLCAVRARCEELNYGCDEFFYAPDARSRRQLARVIASRGIRGLIVAPHVSSPEFHLELDLSRLHAVSIGRNLAQPALHRACSDLFAIVTFALRHLRELGYRRVGLLCHELEDLRSRHRVTGAYHAMTLAENGMEPLPVFRFGQEIPTPALATWLREHRPDCVLTPFDVRAALEAAMGASGRRPAYASFNVLPNDHETTGVRQPYERLAAAAVDLLATSLAHHTAGIPEHPRQITVAPTWQPGRTAPGAPRAGSGREAMGDEGARRRRAVGGPAFAGVRSPAGAGVATN